MLAVLRERTRQVAPVAPTEGVDTADLIPRDRLVAISEAFPSRGDASRLAEIAGWGAAICALTLEPEPDAREVLAAAASFNLAVALFDTLVDERVSDLGDVARRLHPDHLRELLCHPSTNRIPATMCDSEVVQLFDSAVRTAGRRWQDLQEHLTMMGDLLEAMYCSELGTSSDPFAAKEQPVLFLGAIGSADQRGLELHRSLGRFIAAWDDWLDQDQDILARRANVFFGIPCGRGLVGYYVRALWRTIGGTHSQSSVIELLESRLDVVLRNAAVLGDPAAARTIILLTKLFQ